MKGTRDNETKGVQRPALDEAVGKTEAAHCQHFLVLHVNLAMMPVHGAIILLGQHNKRDVIVGVIVGADVANSQ
jgi:hypothetical protein